MIMGKQRLSMPQCVPAVLEGHLLMMSDNYIEVLELPSLRVVQVWPAARR